LFNAVTDGSTVQGYLVNHRATTLTGTLTATVLEADGTAVSTATQTALTISPLAAAEFALDIGPYAAGQWVRLTYADAAAPLALPVTVRRTSSYVDSLAEIVSLDFATEPVDATVELYDAADQLTPPYLVRAGGQYTYTVRADGFVTAEGTLTPQADQTVNVTLTPVNPAIDRQLLQVAVNLFSLFDATPNRWTSATYQPFHEAMEQAKALLLADSPSGAEVRRLLNLIPVLANALVEAADTAVLDSLIAASRDVLADPAAYQNAHLAELAQALTQAEAVRDANPTQAEIDAAATALLQALVKVHKLGDKTLLQALLGVITNLNTDRYTPSSWLPVAAAVTAGQAVADDVQADQFAVDAAVQQLETALNGLVLRAVKAGLASAIAVAQSILANPNAYVPSTLAGLADACNTAQMVYDNADSSQADVTAAQSTLVGLIAQAKLRITGSSGLLPAGLAAKAAADTTTTKVAAAAKLAKPHIKGQAKVGAKLRVKLAGSQAGLHYQWYRGSQAIKGATKATYRVKASDKGKRLRVKVIKAGATRLSAITKTTR
jgi:hypothetical protein